MQPDDMLGTEDFATTGEIQHLLIVKLCHGQVKLSIPNLVHPCLQFIRCHQNTLSLITLHVKVVVYVFLGALASPEQETRKSENGCNNSTSFPLLL